MNLHFYKEGKLQEIQEIQENLYGDKFLSFDVLSRYDELKIYEDGYVFTYYNVAKHKGKSVFKQIDK